jgi:hypothetical protein
MKRILTVVLLLLSAWSFSQDKKPKYYKFINGNYYTTHQNNEGEIDTVVVRRHDNIQIETRLKNGEESEALKLKVIWVNEAKYILRVKTIISNSKKIRPSDVVCKIIETGEDYYIVKAWLKKGKKMTIRLNVYKEK